VDIPILFLLLFVVFKMAAFLKKIRFTSEIVPLLGAVGVGCGLAVYSMGRNLSNNADVSTKRGEGYSWQQIGDPEKYNPYYPFLAGKARNEAVQDFVRAGKASDIQ